MLKGLTYLSIFAIKTNLSLRDDLVFLNMY